MANIKDTVGSLFETASKWLSDVKESVSEAASYAWDKIGDIVDYALETPKSPQADQFKAWFQDFGKRIEESKNAPTISDSIVDLYNQGKQNLSDNYNQLKEDLIPARDAIGRTIDNVIKENIATPEERKNSLLGKIISGDSAFKETWAKFRKWDEELANDYAKINSEDSSKWIVGAWWEAFKWLLSGSDLEKALPTTMSESDFFRRTARFGQEINEESNRLATLQAESRFSAYNNFTKKLENEFRTVKGIPVTDEIDQDQLNEYFSMKLDTLPRSEAKTIINQYKSFNSEAKKIYDAINLKQENIKTFLNETLKFPGKTGEEVYNDFSEKANANESTNKYIKVLQKQYNLAKTDVDKQLDFYAPVLAKADNFKQWSELIDSMYETSAQQKSYIANARNLPISKGLQDEIISKWYDSYDASLRYMWEYAKFWADPEMRKQYPDSKFSTIEFKKIVMHEVEKNISASDKKAIEDMDKLMARVEIERNRNSASNTKLDLSNKKFNIPFADTDLIYADSRAGNAASNVANIGTYLGKQWYNIYWVAGWIWATAGLSMRDKAGYYAENIADYYHQYNPLWVAGWIWATAGLWMRDKDGYRAENIGEWGSSEFRDIARKYREQNGEAYLDRTIRSEFNWLLRSGENASTAGKELVAGNITEVIPMVMGVGLVSLWTKVIRVWADIGTKTIGTGINKVVNTTIANPKVLKQVTNIWEKLQAGQAAKLIQETWSAIKSKTNNITTSISTRLWFDDIEIPAILQTSAKMAWKIGNGTADKIGRLVDYSIKSIGSSAVTDPTFNVIAGDAPTDMIQGMNATIGLLFDAGISTGISTVKGWYRFGKKLTGYATGKEISAPTPETTIFQETGRFLNDSMNNIMYGFVTGNQMKAVKQVQDAYIKNGINLSGQEAKALLDSGAAMYRSIYDPKQVSDLFNNKWELATFLAKNISEMDKNNMTELLTGKWIGIKLHKFAGLEEWDFNNLGSLINATKTLKDPGQQKAARLQINAYLSKVEDFVTGKGWVDRISIAKEFSDNKDIMAKNKAWFDKRKANLLSANTPEEISDAMDELNWFIYKIQATQWSERHKQIVTLTDGNPDNKITITFEEISQLWDKNIDDLINEWRITIGPNDFGRKEWIYTVVDTRFEQTVTDIINGNQEIKQLINKFKENIDSWEYAVKIWSKELDRAIIWFFTGNKSKIEWTWIDPKLSIEYANLVRDIANKIFIDADIPQVVVIPNAEKGTTKMSSWANIINMLGEVEWDIVISTGSYVRKDWDNTVNAIYITLGKNFTENPAMKSVFDTIDQKADGILNIYLSEVKKLMEDIFELSQDGKWLSLDKGRTLYTNLYDALGNPTKDENKILEDIYSITQDIESTHFIMDVLKKSNASNQSHAGLLAINLAYAYRLNKTLIDELIARGKKAGDNMDNIHSVFSKILLGNVQDVYARVFGKEYNFDIPTTEIADAYHRARLEYINGYENQKFLLKQENEKLTVDYNANKDTDVRKALKKLMKENDKRIKNIDKILSKVNTFKESFIKDLATKQAFGYIKSLADMVSYNFLFREADDTIGTTFMKAIPPLLKRWIAWLLPPGWSVPDFVPPVEETKLIEWASQKLLWISEQKLLATTGNIAWVEKAMTYQDALRDLFMDSYNKLKELPPINQAQVLELLANYSKNKTTQLREAFYRETMEKFNRDILWTKGKNSILIKKKELFKNLANEFLFSNPRLDLLDNISLDVLSGVTPVYSQAYLKDNPLVLTSLTSAINGSTAGDESIKQAFLKTLGVPEGIDFIQYINSPEWAELKNRINDLYADNMNVYQKIDQRLKWIKWVIHSTMKDITIDTFDGNKKVNVTSDLLRKFFNSNQFADLIKTLKVSNEKVKVENVYDINGNLVEDYITIPLKLKRMEASGMDMKYTIGVDKIDVIQYFKDWIDTKKASITKEIKAFRKQMIDEGRIFMWSFWDKDSYLQWYKPTESKFDPETTYLQEYALSEKYIIGDPKSKKDILKALASGDSEWLNNIFKLTSITKREASQMSERNTFEKVDMPVMTYVFDETVNDKDLIPSITIYPDGTWESDITLSPSEFGHIQNHIDNAYIDWSLNIDKANDDINHYLENVFSKEDSKWNRKSYQDGFSVMSDKLMTLRNKISAYFKETDEVKDHAFWEHNGHAFMFKTQFNRWVIKFDWVEIEHWVAIGDGSFKMGWENMKPYPDWENHYIMIDDVPHRLKYPPFEISTQDFKSASSDSVKRQEQASTGSAIFARLPAEYAEEIGEIQEQDIIKLWNKTVGNLLDLNVNVSGYSRILKYMQALQEYTGVGDKHSSIISAKVDEFVNEVNALLTNTKVDAGSAYIRQVDRNISDQEILLSKNHPVVRKAQENTDSYVELENIKREELWQEALTQAEIASYRESQLVTTMYRFPVPSMYNIWVYKILVLEDELAKGNTKFKKYSKMGEKQMVLSPMVAYLKLEADFDGDKVFFAPLNTEYGQVIAKSILGVPASFDRADIGKYAVDAINNNEFRNKYVRTAQVEDIKVQKVERFKWRWTRNDVKLQDDKVFLFGDNTDDRLNTHHIPTSTQAVIRWLPNAIGIDTKKNRGTIEDYNLDIVGKVIEIETNNNDFFKSKIDSIERKANNFLVKATNSKGKQYTYLVDSLGQPVNKNSFFEYVELPEKFYTNSYFEDSDFDVFKQQVDEAIQKAKDSGKTIVISDSGIWTDKAQLEKRAPKLFKYLQSELNKLEKSSTKWDNKSIVQDRLTKLIAKKGIGEVSATYRSLFLLQQEVTMRLKKDPNFFDKLKQDSEWNLLKTFSMNREWIDSEMASGLQIVLDFGKSGLTEFDTQFLNDIIYKAFWVTSDSPYIWDIQKLVQSLSTSFGNNFPISKFDFKAPMKDKFGKEIEEGSKPITKSWVIFDTMNSIFKQYSSYLSILWSNNEKKILSGTLGRNKLTSLRSLYSDFVAWDRFTMAGIKNNIFNGRDTPYVAYINRVNKELTDMINSWSIDGIVLSEAKKKMLLSLIDNFQKEFDSFISSIRSTKNTRALKDIKFKFYLSDHVDIARFSEEEKLVLAFMSSVYGERYLKDYYSAGDLTRYIIDTQEEGENNIRSVLNRMASDWYEVDNLDSNAVLALFQRDTITKSDVKDLIENTKAKMDNLNQLKSELIETEAPSKELTESLETLNSAIKNTEKELLDLDIQSKIVSIRDKALSKDDKNALSLYNQIDNWLINNDAISDVIPLSEIRSSLQNKFDEMSTPTSIKVDSETLDIDLINESDITNEFGDVSVVTPAYTPKMDYGSMLISVHDEGLMDDMIKEMDKLDRLQQDGLVFTLKKTTQKWLPDFYNLYEWIRNIVNYENKIPAASDYNVREFTWIPFVKNIYSILKDKKLSWSEIRSLMPEFQSMLLANNMWVYRAYDEDVITRALESLESKNELLLGISKDEAFRKRVTDYVTNVINPVADMLNEIQERVMKPNGDTIGKHYWITDKDNKASEFQNKLVQDLLESHKWDPQFARVLSSIYDKADLQKLLIDRQTERGEKIFYGTENNLNELMFGIDLGVLSKWLNAMLWLTQSFNYSMTYGAVSLVTWSGMIAGISQLIPNIVELIAYKRAYSKDIDKWYDVMLKYNVLDSENVIRNGTGHGKNIDPNIIGEAIGRVAAWIGYIPVKIGIGMYNVLANSIKISNSSVAQAIDGWKYAKAAWDLTNSFLTNPLWFFDFPLENMRKAVAVTTVMNNLWIKSLKEFDDIVERFGDKFLNKFNALVSWEFANTGGWVVSASSIQRRNVFDSAYNMVPAAIRPAAYFINKAAGFLMWWAFHKTAVWLEMTWNVMWSFKRLCDGDVKQSFAHFEAASRYTYMLAQQSMILLWLYMQMEKREKDPEDMQSWDNFLKAYSNIWVVYDMVFGKYVDMKMDINEIDPNASIGDQAGMFAYMQAEQIFRTFNQWEFARMVHDYYVKKNAAAGPNGEWVTIIDALLWALDQKYATSMRIINADLADRHYDTLNTANTAMLLTEWQSITDEVTDLFDKKKYDKFKSQWLWMSLIGMWSKLLWFTESEAVTASIAEDIRKQILGEDKEISKLYNGWQISEIPGDYQLSTIIGKTKNPITDDEKESVDNIWSKIGYYKYNAVNRQGKRIIANDASESKSQQIIEKEFERIQKEKGVDMEKLLSASPNSPDFEVALAMVATESNIATPTIIAYKLEKEYNNERTRLQKLVGKKEITGYKGLDAYQESEIKRNILTKNQVLLNLATPFAEIIVGEHMDKYHSDIFDRLTPKDWANQTSKWAPDKNEYIKWEVINLINTHQLIAKNVAEWDTNVDRLTSKFALATKWISNTEVGANIIIGMLHDIERLPIDKKAKLANQAALIMGLNKSQYQFMKDNAEFEKLTEDSQRQLTNWMYKINTEVNDFDSNNLSFKANEAGSNYSKYPKTFKKTPYRIPGEYSKSGIGGQRPNFSKQFGWLQNMMSGKEDLVVPRYDKYLSNKEEEYARSLPPAPSYGSHYKQTFYRYTIQNTFYWYDSKWTLNPFINPSTVKWPVKRFIKLKKKFKKKK